jgi:hypothetical protein
LWCLKTMTRVALKSLIIDNYNRHNTNEKV